MPSDRDILINITAKAENLTSEINRVQQSLQQLSSGVKTSNATLQTHTQTSTQAAAALGNIRPNVQTSTGALGAFKQATQASGAALQMHGQAAQATGASLGTVRAGAQTSGGALGQLGTSTKTSSDALKSHNQAAEKTASSLRTARTETGSFASSLSSAKDKIVAYAASYLAIQTAINGVKAIMGAGFGQERLERSFVGIAGSVAKGREELDALRATAMRLGLDFTTLAEGFKGLSGATLGTTLAGQQTRDIFMAIVESAQVLGLSNEQLKNSLRAVGQMASTGVVQFDELRNELGQALPVTMTVAQRAMQKTGVDFRKLVETGTLLTTDFLPKFGKQLRTDIVEGMRAASGSALLAEEQFRKMGNVVTDLMADIGRSDFVGRIANSVGRLADKVNSLREARDALLKTDTTAAKEKITGATGGVPLTRDTQAAAEKELITINRQLEAHREILKTTIFQDFFKNRIAELEKKRFDLLEKLRTQLPTLREPPDLLEGDSERIAQGVGTKRDERAVQTTRALADRDRIVKEAEALRTTKTVEGLAPEEVAKAVADFYKEEIKKFEKATAELRAKEVTVAPTPTAVPMPAVTARPATILTPPPMTTPGTPLRAPENQRLIMERAAQRYNLDPLLVEALAWQESRFNPLAESNKHLEPSRRAKGVMQLMDPTAAGLGVTNSFDTEQNIMGGAKYLAQLIEKFPGDMERVLAAYNAGPGRVLKAGEDLAKLPLETKKYVPAVLAQHQALQAVTGQLPLPMRSPELASATPVPATTATGALADLAARQKEQRKLTDEIIGTAKAEEEHAEAITKVAEEVEEISTKFRENTQALGEGKSGMDEWERSAAIARLEVLRLGADVSSGIDPILEMAKAHDVLAKAVEDSAKETKLSTLVEKEAAQAWATVGEEIDKISQKLKQQREAAGALRPQDKPAIQRANDLERLQALGAGEGTMAMARDDAAATTQAERMKEIEREANRIIPVMGSLTEAILHGGDAWVQFAETALQALTSLLAESKGFRDAMTEIFTSIAQGIANLLKPKASGGGGVDWAALAGTVVQVAGAAGGGDFNYHGQSGGVFAPGQRWNVGEAGRELMVTSKSIRLVGVHGPEIVRPTEAGMVIPHQETMTILRKNALHLAPTMLAHAARQDKLSPLRTAAQVGIPLPSVLRQSLPSAGTGTYDNVVANMARREAGGPVAAGNQYLTGEGGVELLMGAQAGRGGAGGKGPNIINVNMHLHEVREANTFVRSRAQVARALRSAVDDGTRGIVR